ncbi:MAG: response regulator [Gemmatimonadales bacterium]
MSPGSGSARSASARSRSCANRPTDPRSRGSGLPDPSAARQVALVIDDEPSIRMALRRCLAREGWQVEEAMDGRAALDRLIPATGPAPHFDLIICDLRMPGCSGSELHERLKAERPALLRRLIVATGDTVSEDAADFVRRTSCPVLQKPFELSELRSLVHRVVEAA